MKEFIGQTRNGLFRWSFKSIFVTSDQKAVEAYLETPTFHTNWLLVTLEDGDFLILGGEVICSLPNNGFRVAFNDLYLEKIIREDIFNRIKEELELPSESPVWLTDFTVIKEDMLNAKTHISRLVKKLYNNEIKVNSTGIFLFEGCYVVPKEEDTITALVIPYRNFLREPITVDTRFIIPESFYESYLITDEQRDAFYKKFRTHLFAKLGEADVDY